MKKQKIKAGDKVVILKGTKDSRYGHCFKEGQIVKVNSVRKELINCVGEYFDGGFEADQGVHPDDCMLYEESKPDYSKLLFGGGGGFNYDTFSTKYANPDPVYLTQLQRMCEDLAKGGENKMQEFNVGDKVELNTSYGHCFAGRGIVETCSDGSGYDLHVVSKDYGSCHCHQDAWKLVSSANKTMANLKVLTEEQVAGLDADDQALLELGLINENLTVNPAGLDYLLKYLFQQNRKALAAKAAKEVLAAKAEAKKAAK